MVLTKQSFEKSSMWR